MRGDDRRALLRRARARDVARFEQCAEHVGVAPRRRLASGVACRSLLSRLLFRRAAQRAAPVRNGRGGAAALHREAHDRIGAALHSAARREDEPGVKRVEDDARDIARLRRALDDAPARPCDARIVAVLRKPRLEAAVDLRGHRRRRRDDRSERKRRGHQGERAARRDGVAPFQRARSEELAEIVEHLLQHRARRRARTDDALR